MLGSIMAKKINNAASELGKAGARARQKALSPERRKEIARRAAEARWARVRAEKSEQ